MTDIAARWGVLPSYRGYQGDLVKTSDKTASAILAAMGTDDRPLPPLSKRLNLPPGRCSPAPERVWGWAVQMYAVRSRDSWGIGDFADLRRFARWSRRNGASVLLINPLAAQTPTRPQQPCPYYGSSRRFRNPLYLRVEEIPGAEQCATEIERLAVAARALNNRRLIDHDEVFRFKSKALERVFRAAPEPRGLVTWVRRQGQALHDFATFNALAEAHGPAWRDWPQSIRHPRGSGLQRRGRALLERIAFHSWLQFHAHRQMSEVASEITIIADVPIGFASDGFDAWRWQDLLAPGIRVGAPPDGFFPEGQDWGMPAFDPWKLQEAHFEPFVETLRSALAHAKGLRLDHVMGLFRLFWIPPEAGALNGAYMRYPGEELLAILASESRRHRAFVVGEDLGLVEPSMRKRLGARGVLSYRLLWFEGGKPSTWSKDALAAVSTHDLPTVAGIWNLSEPDKRHHPLRKRLLEIANHGDRTSPVEVAVTAYEALAAARSRVVLVSLEDALGVEERPNIPGTTNEWPNWRLAIPQRLEDIEVADGPRRIAEVMKAAGR